MNLSASIIAGLICTLIMTGLIYMAPSMKMPKMDIINMLGTMFTTGGSTAVVSGTLMHFIMGAIFASIYALFWAAGVGNPTWTWGLIFGAAHAILAILVIPVLMRMHPRPPAMESGPKTMLGLLMGHLVSGLVVALAYPVLA